MSYATEWTDLERAGSNGAGRLVRRIHPDSAIDLFLAVTKPGNRRVLTLSVRPEAVEQLDDLPSGKGIEATLRAAPDEGRMHLELGLVDTSCTDIFAALVEDVAGAVAPAPDDRAAVAAWIARLRRWQRLLEHLSPDGLSGERQRGLYAELWLLRHHLVRLLGPEATVLAWTGPDAASHDFELPSAAIEVKATAGKQHQVLRIASERQLDDTGVAALFLFHLSLDVRHGEGETLIQAVSASRELMADTSAAATFEDRLLAAGYSSPHEPRYRHTAYTVREFNFFQVGEGFPRITEANLLPGVGDVRYSVAVAECKHWRVGPELVMASVAGTGADR
ncbi:MAG TPA: PD-(D/E)XK motif protein [Thermoleophilaceae bacterium]|nr:PD-(D/E)XK motif protein [Thermoleophilaceae bacterium]